MQDGWRKEINEVLFELRKKEKVNKTPHYPKIGLIQKNHRFFSFSTAMKY